MDLFKKDKQDFKPKFNYNEELDSYTLFNNLFYRDLRNCQVIKYPVNYKEKKSYDKATITFEYNNLGYRGRYDINGEAELLILGCSQTYGTGLPLECTWGDIFSQKTNKKYALLAQEGDSIQAQVYKAFKYFEEFGNPKIIVGVFPLTRLEYTSIPNKLNRKNEKQKTFNKDSAYIEHGFSNRGEPIQLSVIPHDLDEILPREFYVFYNFMFIQMLEQYCKSNNIILIWNCYQDQGFIDYVQSNIPQILKNYLHISYEDIVPKFLNYDDVIPQSLKDFGSDLSHLYDDRYEYKKLLYRAADFEPGKHGGHWGIYTHRYISDFFYLEYLNRIESLT